MTRAGTKLLPGTRPAGLFAIRRHPPDRAPAQRAHLQDSGSRRSLARAARLQIQPAAMAQGIQPDADPHDVHGGRRNRTVPAAVHHEPRGAENVHEVVREGLRPQPAGGQQGVGSEDEGRTGPADDFDGEFHRLRMCQAAVAADFGRAWSAMKMSAQPPKIRLMPRIRPSAQSAVPGSPMSSTTPRTISMMPLASIHPQRPESALRCSSAYMIVTTPSANRKAINTAVSDSAPRSGQPISSTPAAMPISAES